MTGGKVAGYRSTGVWRATRLSLLLLVGVWICSPARAQAHAILLGSNPLPERVLTYMPSQVLLWFSEDVNAAASRIVVLDQHRTVVSEDDTSLVPGQPRQLRVDLLDAAGSPVRQAHVVVLSNMQEMDMGIERVVLKHVTEGQYVVRVELSMGGGTWHFQFLLYRPSGLTRLAVDDLVGG